MRLRIGLTGAATLILGTMSCGEVGPYDLRGVPCRSQSDCEPLWNGPGKFDDQVFDELLCANSAVVRDFLSPDAYQNAAADNGSLVFEDGVGVCVQDAPLVTCTSDTDCVACVVTNDEGPCDHTTGRCANSTGGSRSCTNDTHCLEFTADPAFPGSCGRLAVTEDVPWQAFAPFAEGHIYCNLEIGPREDVGYCLPLDPTPYVEPGCGDGVIDGVEVCDCGADETCTAAEIGHMGDASCAGLTDPASGLTFEDGELGCSQLRCQHDTSRCFVRAWSEDWESGDFASSPWVQGGDAPWEIDGAESREGAFSARSGSIGASAVSDLTITLTFPNDGWVGFASRIVAQGGMLSLALDAGQMNESYVWWGQDNPMWEDAVVAIPAGTHTLTWSFTESLGATGSAWIDDIRSDGSPP